MTQNTDRLIVARVEWMKRYDGAEPIVDPQGRWAKWGNDVGERHNFTPQTDGYCYGFWQVGETNGKLHQLHIEKLRPTKADFLRKVTVVFVARDPASKEMAVVGFYVDAVLYRWSIESTEHGIACRAKTRVEDAFLIPPSERISYRFRSKQKWFTYGDPSDKEDLALLEYVNATANPAEGAGCDRIALEGRRKRNADRMERYHSNLLRRLVIRSDDDLVCEACGLSHMPSDHEAMKARFEVHHRALVSTLNDGEKREVTAGDLAVLCACCHRSVHRTDSLLYISNISRFRREILKLN